MHPQVHQDDAAVYGQLRNKAGVAGRLAQGVRRPFRGDQSEVQEADRAQTLGAPLRTNCVDGAIDELNLEEDRGKLQIR